MIQFFKHPYLNHNSSQNRLQRKSFVVTVIMLVVSFILITQGIFSANASELGKVIRGELERIHQNQGQSIGVISVEETEFLLRIYVGSGTIRQIPWESDSPVILQLAYNREK